MQVTPDSDDAHPFSRRQRRSGAWFARLALVLAVFVNNANFSATTVALPSMQRSLGLGFSGLQWAMTAYLVTYSAFMLLGGRLSDTLGVRRVLLAGIGLYLVALLIVASAVNPPLLFGGRALQGIAAAMITPATTSAARTRFTGAAQTAAIGLIVGMSAIGQAVGPVLGGLLDQGIGWRAVFGVNVPLLAVSAALTAISMPPGKAADRGAGGGQRRRWQRGRLDVAGAVVFAVSLALLTIALTQAGNHGLASPGVDAMLAAAAAGLAVFGVRSSRRSDALLEISLFRSATFVASTVVGFTMTLSLATILFFGALALERVGGYGSIATGLVFLPMTAVFGVLSLQAARVERRFGHRLPAISGMATACTGTAVLAYSGPGTARAGVLAGLFLVGLGLGVAWTHVTSIGLRAVPAGTAGQAAGILFTARWIGGTIGISVLGIIYRSAADSRLSSQLHGLGAVLSHGRMDQLDGLLSGSAQARLALAGLPGPARAAAVAAVRAAASTGTSWALTGTAIVTAAGALLCLLFPRRASAPDGDPSGLPRGAAAEPGPPAAGSDRTRAELSGKAG